MRFEVEKLSAEGTLFQHEYAPEEIRLEEARLLAPVAVRGRVWRKGREVLLRGDLAARVEVHCDRCLREFETQFEVKIDVAYVPEEDDAMDENLELRAEDMGQSVFNDGFVDLDELVREQLLLAFPLQRLCREECRGFCTRCGADLNVEECRCSSSETDPRWAALAAWKERKESEQD